ncbi:MAG TPA: HDOD domain-containing protein [Steroidobacteraceae bacterium]|jgi:HD-like signal output (HDOD) protein|nr:HDOD domain-containing protein [Steroidobacteraceae bacterium]
MATSEALAAVSLQPIGPALAEFTHAIAQDLAGATPELPSFPDVALRVRKALANDDIAVDDVVRIVSAEPSLAVRLLQLANSVALNPAGRRVITLRAAISRIGFNLARSATIAFAMSQMRRAESWRGLETHFQAIWEASARLAATGYAVAHHLRRADADQALLAGMLNSVGRLFVLTRVSRFPSLFADAAVRGEIENAWHARAARVLLVRWELPDEVLAAACDFTLTPDPVEPKADGSLADVLLAARYLVNVDDPAGLAGAAFLAAAPFARLRLDARDVGEILTVSAAEIASLHAALA